MTDRLTTAAARKSKTVARQTRMDSRQTTVASLHTATEYQQTTTRVGLLHNTAATERTARAIHSSLTTNPTRVMARTTARAKPSTIETEAPSRSRGNTLRSRGPSNRLATLHANIPSVQRARQTSTATWQTTRVARQSNAARGSSNGYPDHRSTVISSTPRTVITRRQNDVEVKIVLPYMSRVNPRTSATCTEIVLELPSSPPPEQKEAPRRSTRRETAATIPSLPVSPILPVISELVPSPICSPTVRVHPCPICYMDIEPGSDRNLMATECGHLFCNICLTESFKIRPVCPLCQLKIDIENARMIFF